MDQLTNLESTILRILEAHQGQNFSISRKDFVEEVNSNCPLFPNHDRQIRQTIKHLITQHGIPIGSCKKGYFLVETSKELEKVCKYFRNYALSQLFVESRLRKMHIKELLGQMALEIGG